MPDEVKHDGHLRFMISPYLALRFHYHRCRETMNMMSRESFLPAGLEGGLHELTKG